VRSDEHRQQLDGWRLLAGFGLAALTLVVIAVVSYRNSTRLIEDDAWVAHTHQVRGELVDLLSEWTQRRANAAISSPSMTKTSRRINRRSPQIQGTLSDVRKLTADNPDQQRRLNALRP
jgi:CHASE3 domain sensor protein